MKKLFALLLAVMMVLASASVLAEAVSPTGETTKPVAEEAGAAVIVTDLGEQGNQCFEALTEIINNNQDVLDAFSPETKELVAAVVGENRTVHEMFGAGYTEGMDGYILVPEFATEYKPGDAVSAVLVIDGAESVLISTVVEDNKVAIAFDGEDLAKLAAANEAFVVLVSDK